MTEFLRCICFHLDFTQKWDDLLWLHYKNIELEELDNEDLVPPQIEISHFLMCFIFDFSFTFISNFTTIDNNYNLVTKFVEFYGFFNYAVSILACVNHNFFNAYKVSDLKKKIIEVDCEKTEYKIKDTFNHYGVAILLYLVFKGDLKTVDLKTKKVLSSFPLPLCVNPKFLSEIQESILHIILKFENSAEINLFKEYKLICLDLLDMIIKNNFGLNEQITFSISGNHSVLLYVLLEIMITYDKYSSEQKEFLSKLFLRIESNSLLSLITASNNLENLKKVLLIFTDLHVQYHNVGSDCVKTLLERFCFNTYILDEVVFLHAKSVVNGGFKDMLNSLLEDLVEKNKFIKNTTHDSKENVEKEIELFNTNHEKILGLIKQLLN